MSVVLREEEEGPSFQGSVRFRRSSIVTHARVPVNGENWEGKLCHARSFVTRTERRAREKLVQTHYVLYGGLKKSTIVRMKSKTISETSNHSQD